jgi:transposase InsO family protein
MKTLAAEYSIAELCPCLGVSRSGYYAWCQRRPGRRALANELLCRRLQELFERNRRVYGSPRLTQSLQREGIPCSRNRVARHMRGLGLRARQKRAFRPKTTDSRHPHPIAPNRLTAVRVKRPDEVWVSDITYIATAGGWVYLAGVMDLCSRKIVGWATADHLKSSLVQAALDQAVAGRAPAAGLISHSDRGVQYASHDYRQSLQRIGSLPSMSGRGHCYDNAAMESFWSTLKTEWLHGQTFRNRQEAELAIFDYIETFYNPRRLHSALGYRSPVEFELELLHGKP